MRRSEIKIAREAQGKPLFSDIAFLTKRINYTAHMQFNECAQHCLRFAMTTACHLYIFNRVQSSYEDAYLHTQTLMKIYVHVHD